MQHGSFLCLYRLPSLLTWVQKDEEGGNGSCFPLGKKKMNGVKSEWCDLLRAIPQVRTLIKHIYFTPPASSAFQLGFWEQKEKVIKSLRV